MTKYLFLLYEAQIEKYASLKKNVLTHLQLKRKYIIVGQLFLIAIHRSSNICRQIKLKKLKFFFSL